MGRQGEGETGRFVTIFLMIIFDIFIKIIEEAKGRSMKKSALYFSAAGVLLVSTWLLYFLLLHNPVVQWLVYAGWAIFAVGLVFIFISGSSRLG